MAVTHRTQHGILPVLASFTLVLGACSNDGDRGANSSAQSAQPDGGSNGGNVPEDDENGEGEGPSDGGKGTGVFIIGGVVIPPVLGPGAPFGDLPPGAVPSNAEAVRILEVVNLGEIAAARIELARGSTTPGKKVANTILTESSAALLRAQRLETFVGEGVDSPLSLNLTARADAAVAGLSAAMPSGVDIAYLDLQIFDHATLLNIIDGYLARVPRAIMKEEVATTRLEVQGHLDDAKRARQALAFPPP